MNHKELVTTLMTVDGRQPEDLVIAISQLGGILFDVVGVEREVDPDTGVATVWVKVEEH